MAKKKTTRRKAPPPAEARRPAVTAERFGRLVRLVRALAKQGHSREQLTKQLALDVRGFYRDLELLRAAGIAIVLVDGEYTLGEPADEVLARLPFPDPHLTLGDARQLARGRSNIHKGLQRRIEELLG